MARLFIKSDSGETAIAAASEGEALHAESTSSGVAAIAGIQMNTTPGGTGAGVYAETKGTGPALVAVNDVDAAAGPGGYGASFRSSQKEAVHAESKSPTMAAVACYQNNPDSTGAALYAKHIAGVDGTAAVFEGNVVVTGDLSFPGADFAEDFSTRFAGGIEPGTVVVLDRNGQVEPSQIAYDKSVVGVAAGGGSHRTAIIMDRQSASDAERLPIALMGKVFTKVDASHGEIRAGDLLTTSSTPGHAMRAADRELAFGAVIGKALGPLSHGTGLVPMLIALQ